MRNALLLAFSLAAIATTTSFAAKPRVPVLSPESVNNAEWSAGAAKGKLDARLLKAQVLLDRAHYSPGVIDAREGENFQKALKAFQGANDLDPTGRIDAATWAKLTASSARDALIDYMIDESDVTGPFVRVIPKDFEKMAALDHLGYHSARELLAEKFHMSEELLSVLNRGSDFNRVGSKIVVANVAPLDTRTASAARKAQPARHRPAIAAHATGRMRVEVNKSDQAVRVYTEDGSLLAYYPASIGSAEKPAPSGTFQVRQVEQNPTYRYDPKYGFKGQKAKRPVNVAPGPNNPVGLVWIGLSAPSYGIHGTPSPEAVSKTQSHGCIRLTNWDALSLAKLVRKGTRVDFIG